MEFSVYSDVREERLDQIAAALCEIYGAAPQNLPPEIRTQMERLLLAAGTTGESSSSGA